jgi:Tfp pilus assembly protein PilF
LAPGTPPSDAAGFSQVALQILDVVMAARPTDSVAFMQAARVHSRINDFAAAERMFLRAIDNNPRAYIAVRWEGGFWLTRQYNNLGALYVRHHVFDKAIIMFRAAAGDPSYFDAHRNLAV